MSRTCLRCKGQNWLEYGHWLICRDCDPAFVDKVEAGWQVDVVPAFKPELFDKGIPSKPGG